MAVSQMSFNSRGSNGIWVTPDSISDMMTQIPPLILERQHSSSLIF